MGDVPYVNPGDDLVIVADDWNAFVDAANHHSQTRTGITHGDRGTFDFQGETFFIQNSGSTGISRFYPVVLTQPVILPADNTTGFQNEIVFKAMKPDGTKPGIMWGIMQEPVAANAFGQCKTIGLTHAYVNLSSSKDLFIRISDTNGDLISGGYGDADIVWAKGWETGTKTATTTGWQWATIRLGTAQNVRIGYISNASGSSYPPTWTYTLWDDQSMTRKIADNVAVSSSTPSRFCQVYATPAGSGSRVLYWYENGNPVIILLPERTVTQECPA